MTAIVRNLRDALAYAHAGMPACLPAGTVKVLTPAADSRPYAARTLSVCQSARQVMVGLRFV